MLRTFFAIDRYSTLRPSTIRNILAITLSRRQYEVLPIEVDYFPCLRKNHNELVGHATREGRKVLEHYQDARQCVVIFGAETCYAGQPESTARFDYALAVRRDNSTTIKLLNPPVANKENIFWVSSPGLQPELIESVLELADLSHF